MVQVTSPFVYSTLHGDPDLGELVALFVAEMPDRMANLMRHYDGGDRQAFCRAVHQIKGAAGSYGFHGVTPLAARLEDTLQHDGPEHRVKAEFDALLDLCRRLR